MQQYLTNLANILLIRICDEKSIDCSGSHLEKIPHKQIYKLIKDDTNNLIATIEFHKNSVPTYNF